MVSGGRKYSEAWLAMIGPHVLPKGEMKSEQQVYQKQIAQTVASILGFEFKAKHAVSNSIDFPSNNEIEKPIDNTDNNEEGSLILILHAA